MLMPDKTETVIIQVCPKCSGTHTYQVFTKRTIVMLLADADKEVNVKKITCLFNCPSTGTTFQTKLKIMLSAKERITSVDVLPVS
jgi:deoxyribose-phosphate aldolase